MRVGLWWEEMIPKVMSSAVMDLMRLKPSSVYYTGADLPLIQALEIPRTSNSDVDVLICYTTTEEPVLPGVADAQVLVKYVGSQIPEPRLRQPQRKTQRQREMMTKEQGQALTYSPYDRPAPDPYSQPAGMLFRFFT